jgi:hypothetical protein
VCKLVAIARFRARIAAVAATFAITCAPFAANAQALRLRGDALVDTQTETQSPTGLLVLQGDDKLRPWLGVEGLVWTGAKPGATADVLVLAMRLHDPHGHGEMRVGRFVLATGAIFPVQIDGFDGLARAAWGGTVEGFAGMPVVPRFGARAYDWLAGGRISQSIATKVTVGVSYIQRREYGEISNEELGADMAAIPASWLTLAAKAAYDVTSPGIADARVSASAKSDDLRFEVFGAEQSPGRLLPSTSLFSVLGDFASTSIGSTVKWNAAPRLDVVAGGAGQEVGDTLGGNAWIRSTLRLDDRGAGSLAFEVRRVSVSTARWTGFRAIATKPIGRGFRYSTEIEIVVPDEPNGRGVVWPWGLMSLGWRSQSGWEVASAVEASSSVALQYEVNALARVSRSLELP